MGNVTVGTVVTVVRGAGGALVGSPVGSAGTLVGAGGNDVGSGSAGSSSSTGDGSCTGLDVGAEVGAGTLADVGGVPEVGDDVGSPAGDDVEVGGADVGSVVVDVSLGVSPGEVVSDGDDVSDPGAVSRTDVSVGAGGVIVTSGSTGGGASGGTVAMGSRLSTLTDSCCHWVTSSCFWASSLTVATVVVKVCSFCWAACQSP